jgi:hypothetical protein
LQAASTFSAADLIIATSKAVAGLQLADVTAYSIGRFLLKRASVEEKTSTAVDTIAAKVVGGFEGRIEHCCERQHNRRHLTRQFATALGAA